MSEQTPAKLADLEEALLFLDAGGDAEAWLCRDTGVVHWHCDDADDFEPLPDDIDDAERYVALPSKHDLDLGKPLALEFARTQLPDCYEQVYAMFSHRSAYARFKDLLDRHDSLDTWHQWETEQSRQALREWCADNNITLAE
ncbi:MAG: hypothetical protein BGP25_12215 [Lysobacterales bacterium 63-13]|nr:MAG: hypothetical protein BGP25_12215 [Xanthomonadales bacterium 63-13]